MIGIDDFKKVLGSFPSGVTVTACFDISGKLYGMTASSFCSVSLEPKLVLMCPSKRAECHDVLTKAKYFSVHILCEEQTDLAWRFASTDKQRMHSIEVQRSPRGAPIFKGCLASIECTQFACYDGGDHSILVGQVEYCEPPLNNGRPLVYCRGKMDSLKG